MNYVQRLLQFAALALLLPVSASLAAREPQGEHPANPAAKTLPLPNDPGPLSTYVDPKLREEQPDAIERSDFEQAKAVSSQAPVFDPSGSTGKLPSDQKNAPAQDLAPSSTHGGHSGHGPGRTDRPKN